MALPGVGLSAMAEVSRKGRRKRAVPVAAISGASVPCAMPAEKAPLLSLSPAAFCEFLATHSIRRFHLVWNETAGCVEASHEALSPIARWLETESPDFDRHEGLFVQVAPQTGVLQSAVVHRTCRGQGAGGVRYWHYDDLEGFLRDGLRLSKGMTHKNALAGLWWGGGKGVMARQTGDAGASRLKMYEEYGEFVTSLKGCYVTAEDVGTSVEDMAAIFTRTRFTTCIPPGLGGSGNPSVPTARGVIRGMEAALSHLGMGSLAGKTVALQGLGHVGEPLLGFLVEKGVSRIIGTDTDSRCVEEVREKHSGRGTVLELSTVPRGDLGVLAERADIVSPCAVGAILNPESIPAISARIVCGAANNQLAEPARDGAALWERGIVYVPDFLVNRMGIVTCADESFGYDDGESIERHLGDEWPSGIYRVTLEVLARARETGSSPDRVALEMAEKLSFEPHPIWGHRPVRIIREVVRSGWAR